MSKDNENKPHIIIQIMVVGTYCLLYLAPFILLFLWESGNQKPKQDNAAIEELRNELEILRAERDSLNTYHD